MTISSALNAGVAGLNANATRLATISDNIANSATYGYKRASTDFESMVITEAPGAGSYSAGGVRATTSRLINERGALVSTANALDIAIAGRGMLPVTCSIPDDHIDPRRSAFFMARSVMRDIRDGVRPC